MANISANTDRMAMMHRGNNEYLYDNNDLLKGKGSKRKERERERERERKREREKQRLLSTLVQVPSSIQKATEMNKEKKLYIICLKTRERERGREEEHLLLF